MNFEYIDKLPYKKITEEDSINIESVEQGTNFFRILLYIKMMKLLIFIVGSATIMEDDYASIMKKLFVHIMDGNLTLKKEVMKIFK